MKKKERLSLKKETTREQTVNRVLLGLIIFLLTIIVLSSIFYLRADRPMAQAEKEAEAIAKKYADMEQVDHFYWFTRKQTYFSLIGKNKDDQEIAVIIPKSGEKVKILDASKGLSESEAKQKVSEKYSNITIQKANLGMFDDKPVWEVMGRDPEGALSYHLISFDSGEETNVIKDI
jgi:uncharacterized protein YpmB